MHDECMEKVAPDGTDAGHDGADASCLCGSMHGLGVFRQGMGLSMSTHLLKTIRHALKRWQLRKQIQQLESARAWFKNFTWATRWGTTWDGSPTQASIDATARLQQLNRELWNLRSRWESLK